MNLGASPGAPAMHVGDLGGVQGLRLWLGLDLAVTAIWRVGSKCNLSLSPSPYSSFQYINQPAMKIYK